MAGQSSASTTSYSLGGAYRYAPDGHGGVNYFKGSTPITNAQYQKATGQNTTQIERSEAYLPGNQPKTGSSFQSFPSFEAAVGTDIPSPSGAASGFSDPAASQQVQPAPTTFLGQNYDLTDPRQAQAYQQAQQQASDKQRQATIDQTYSQLNRSLGDASLSNQRSTDLLNQNIGNVNSSAKDYGLNLFKSIGDLGQNYDLGMVNSGQQFAALSPQAYQSSQGTSQQYGQQQYQAGQDYLKKQGNDALGANYFTSGELDPNSQYGQQLKGYQTQLSDLGTQYGNYVSDAQRQAQTAIQGSNAGYGQQGDALATSLNGNNASLGLNPFQYQVQQYDPYQAGSLDTSRFTPFAPAQQQSASAPQQTASYGSNPLSKILGINPSQSQSNYLNAFLAR